MRFNFDISKTDSSEIGAVTPPRTPGTPNDDVEWVPLEKHPVFTPTTTGGGGGAASRSRMNLLAWDGDSRLYFWDTDKRLLHRLSIRLGEPEPSSVVASSASKVLVPDISINFVVNNVSINRKGSALFLSGPNGLCVMYLFGKTSAKDNAIICRTVSIGSEIYFDDTNPVRILQISWHPYSDTHLGVLSSDSVFRLFDLSCNLEKAEQEFYLQPKEPGKCCNAASICAVGFSFGGEHLWDRFTVFFLFGDGSIYFLCPVVPFGSVHRRESVVEIYDDTHAFGLKASNSRAINNSSLAIAWLEGTFPQLAHQVAGSNLMMLRSHPYAPFNASLLLQGPLCKICHTEDDEDSEVCAAECDGKAVGLLYKSISKDSILVTAWSSGQMQIDALADEIQPVWNVESAPRLSLDSHDHILRLAMICESNADEFPHIKLDHTVWSGHPPPLLRLAVVDLALPGNMDNDSLLSLFNDALIPERIYCLHGGGVDSIVLHFLPFTSQTSGKDDTLRAPSVHPVLSTCQDSTCSPSPLCGFVSFGDSFGYSWIMGITLSHECIVLEVKTWSISMPFQIDGEKKLITSDVLKNADTPDIISRELLNGPKVVVITQASPSLHVSADSIEGRSLLHRYFKLFHENYVEYAHKVWFELKHHGPHLKKIIDDQQARLRQAQRKLSDVEEKQPSLEDRINRAVETQRLLDERFQTLRRLASAHKKPLSKAEQEFKAELDRFTGVELDAMQSSIEVLQARLKRYKDSPAKQIRALTSPVHALRRNKNQILNAQVSQLRSAIEKLSMVNKENSKKVKLVESALKTKESN